MGLVSNFFFHQRFYGVISKKSITVFILRRFRLLLPEKLKTKSENWCKSFFCGPT